MAAIGRGVLVVHPVLVVEAENAILEGQEAVFDLGYGAKHSSVIQAGFVCTQVVTCLAPLALMLPRVRRFMFRTVS